MKTLLILAFAFSTTSSFAAMNCTGTTVIFNDDGTATTTVTELKKIEGDKRYTVYFGESEVFKFYADHDIDAKVMSLEILDKKDTIVLTNPRMAVARFSISIGGYWKNYFASLVCSTKK